MQYRSTRSLPADDRHGFDHVLLEGLAPDGGLYVPDSWPSLPNLGSATYPEIVATVLGFFVEPSRLTAELPGLVADSYKAFSHPLVAPLTDVGDGHYLLELFWGPTMSFKDHALQVVGRLFEALLRHQGRRIVVLGATSGDTGSAAMAACEGRENIEVVILYPEGKISAIQRRQMTTMTAENVRAIAVEGTFDDCQALVKKAFLDRDLDLPLAAINSINWARIAVQASYYVWAVNQVGEPAAFAVPTGNFGNVYSGLVAQKMGTPIAELIVANNRNRGLTELIETGSLQPESVHETVAPAMDIQIPSNLERFLFELGNRSGERVREWQRELSDGRLQLSQMEHRSLSRSLRAGWVADEEVLSVIRDVEAEHGILLDPHTAIAWEVGRRLHNSPQPLITIATAHPAKFGETVRKATGRPVELPPSLASLTDIEERLTKIPNDYQTLVRLLRSG